VSWLHCQKISGLEYWVQLLFNFTPVSVRQVYIGPNFVKFVNEVLRNYKKLVKLFSVGNTSINISTNQG